MAVAWEGGLYELTRKRQKARACAFFTGHVQVVTSLLRSFHLLVKQQDRKKCGAVKQALMTPSARRESPSFHGCVCFILAQVGSREAHQHLP